MDASHRCFQVNAAAVALLLGAAPGFAEDCNRNGVPDSLEAAPPVFVAPRYKVGDLPVSLAVVDMDRDGLLDVVTLNSGSSDLSVLRNRGDGTLEGILTFQVRRSPVSMVAADLDGDGSPDLAVGHQLFYLSVLLRHGAAFAEPVEYWIFYHPTAITAADLDRDGDLDLALVEDLADRVTILRNRGDGSFEVGGSFPAGKMPAAIVAGDFLGDGQAGLAVANTIYSDHGGISVLQNLGDGGFGPPLTTEGAKGVDSLAAADFDGDGRLDLAAGGSYDIRVFWNEGQGLFQPSSRLPVSLFTGRSAVAALRLNGDGSADLAVASGPFLDVTVVPSDRQRTLVPGRSFLAGLAPTALEAGDLNGDGLPDLAVADSDGSVTVLLGDGKGSFAGAEDFRIDTLPVAMAAGDLDGDGNPDLATVSGETQRLSLINNNGSGRGLEPMEDLTLEFTLWTAAVTDLDGDGVPEILSTSRFGRLLVARRGPNGKLQASFTSGEDHLTLGLSLLDFDGDGFLDVAMVDASGGEIVIVPSQGDGTFGPRLRFPGVANPSSLASGDLDGDGRPDLVLGGPGGVFVLRHRKGELEAPQRVAGPARAVILADLEGDEDLDLAALSTGILLVLENQGGGRFALAATYPAPLYARALLASALEDPKKLDLITADEGLFIYQNRGGGKFAMPVALPASADALVSADFDGDGREDLAVATGSGIALLLSRNGAWSADSNQNGIPDECEDPPPGSVFKRGDADLSGAVDLRDALFVLGFLFRGEEPPGCADAADADGSGRINLGDAVWILRYLFQSGPEPPPPGPRSCGRDPDPDDRGLPPCVYLPESCL
jgi:hypothetical protein